MVLAADVASWIASFALVWMLGPTRSAAFLPPLSIRAVSILKESRILQISQLWKFFHVNLPIA
jgi:hypothetical protein